MADVLNRTRIDYRHQFLRSVNTPDYPVADWIIDPRMDAVVGVDQIYWLVTGDIVTEQDQAEKDITDASIEADRRADENSQANFVVDTLSQKAIVNVIVREINILRTIEGLAERTDPQVRAAINAEIDALQGN